MSLSAFHELLVALVRERPSLVRDLLTGELPPGEATVADGAFTQLAPTAYTADLVVMLGSPPALGVVVEVQLRRDDDKRFAWPLYAVALRARHRCPVVVLVLAPDAAVAAWAALPVPLGPGNTFHAHAVGPGAIPAVTSRQAARAAPEAAVLSALAHGDEPHSGRVLAALLAALDVLPDDTARLYYDLVTSRLSAAARQALEDLMLKGNYEYQSDFARKYYGQGLAEGELKGIRRLVLRLLARRLGIPGAELQALIEALDVERLEKLAEALNDTIQTPADLEAWLAG